MISSTHIKNLQCVNCNLIQEVKIKKTGTFNTYYHDCRRCSDAIVGSYFDESESKSPFKLKYLLIPIINLIMIIIGIIGVCILCVLAALEMTILFKPYKFSNLLVSLTNEAMDDLREVNFFKDFYLLNF